MEISATDDSSQQTSPDGHHILRVATWNLDHWKRTVAQRTAAWDALHRWGLDIALLQETDARKHLARDRVIYRPIGGSRVWGSAVAAISPNVKIVEIDAVKTRYSSRLFSMLGTYPGTVMVGRAEIPDVGAVTCVSIYAMMEVYSQTTMLRIIADLIPLFDSREGEHVILGGDFNMGMTLTQEAPEYRRYKAILEAVESLGLKNLADTVENRPDPPPKCQCGQKTCTHLATYHGVQLDHMYATPWLAARCNRLEIPNDEVEADGLSDHMPLIATFDFTSVPQPTHWDSAAFVTKFADSCGVVAKHIVEDLILWAEDKQAQLRQAGHAQARLDRLPTEVQQGVLKMWFQFDFGDQLQWLFAVREDNKVELQFQYMAGEFGSADLRRWVSEELERIPDVNMNGKFTGRPTFLLSKLATPKNLSDFLEVWSAVVDRSVQFWSGSQAAVQDESKDQPTIEDPLNT